MRGKNFEICSIKIYIQSSQKHSSTYLHALKWKIKPVEVDIVSAIPEMTTIHRTEGKALVAFLKIVLLFSNATDNISRTNKNEIQ